MWSRLIRNPMRKPFLRHKTIKIYQRCLDCGQKFTQRARHLFWDLGTMDRKRRGEKVEFSEFVVPARVICPHCGSADRYTLTAWQYLRVILSLVWQKWFPAGPESWLQVAYLGTADGRVMHPFELRAWLADQVTRKPQDVKLRVRYANTLRSQGQSDEAAAQYRAALNIAPRQTEALLNLAALLVDQGEGEEALDFLRKLAAITPKNPRQREHVAAAQDVLNGSLPLDELIVESPLVPMRKK